MFQIPRGTRDFPSEEMQKRRHTEEIIIETFELFGYREVQTPTFETLGLFTAKSGESIIEEIYSFKDKGGRDLALRPELTAPVMRFYVEKMQMNPKPLKLYYIGNCYRYDRPQKGRYREFKQVGCELIGANTPLAYAELIALAYTILRKIGLNHIELKIGNLNILSMIFRKIGLSKEQQKYIIPLIDKDRIDDLKSALQDFGLNEELYEKFLGFLEVKELNKIQEFLGAESEEEIKLMISVFKFLKNNFNIDGPILKVGIVRGLDYYNGIVFEIEAPSLGAEKQICGGGVYNLIKLFGGKDTPTSGFAIGFDRSIVALESEKNVFPELKLDVYVIPTNDDMINESLEIVLKLRKNGIKTDMDILGRSISKSMKYASSLNSRKVIIVGENEIKSRNVIIRDMKSGKQDIVKLDDIIKCIAN